jgi:hypothetical protein
MAEQVSTGDSTEHNSAMVGAVLKCESEIIRADDERRRMVETSGGVDAESKWVKFIGWAKHLQGMDKAMFCAAGLAPVTAIIEVRMRHTNVIKENRRLKLLAESFRREMSRSMRRIEAVPIDTLKWLASVDPAKPEGELFSIKQEREITTRYILYWQRYFCYCARV